ncbi:MAG: cysteine--tRNA ligase [Eggerthellaceae bacterium]|nr:cysteine--tRNA ligase [Eggerthellaceae bacterium]
MIRIYDTRMHKKVDLVTLEHGKVKMYVCGPTVYNYIHIGNARTFMSFDMIRRYLEWRKFDVIFVQNVTDVDDKIINKANEEGRTAAEVAEQYTAAFIEDMHAVNVKDPTVRPNATEEIDTMIALVQKLIDTEHAYTTEDGDVYFSVRSFHSYGSLSGRNIDEMEAGHRDLRTEGIEDRKNDPLDFALWKAAKPGEPAWESPWGMGRPGWHIECSCMSKKYLGLPFDIHGGGADLIFPHHENERAQSEAAEGVTFANHWMHGGMLQINGEKMSKSLNNFFLLRDILETVDPAVLRFLMLQTHYRSPLDFSDERVDEAGVGLERVLNAVKSLDWAIDNAQGTDSVLDAAQVNELVREMRMNYIVSMDDDFNSPKALGQLFDFVASANSLVAGKSLSADDAQAARQMRDLIVELMGVFGIDVEATLAAAQGDDGYPVEVVALAQELAGYAGDSPAEAVEALLDARAAARKEKNWAVADGVRDGMAALGFTIKDTPQGAQVEFAG